ncbi:MAG: GNAT family N-acetyltransferase [Acidimicrobiales bacterium]
MAGPAELLERATRTESAYFELGNRVSDSDLARFVTNPDTPDVWDSNCVTRARAATPGQVEELMAEAATRYAGADHRVFKLDPLTPAALEVRLLLDGYRGDTLLHLVLPEAEEAADIAMPRPGSRPAVSIRPAESDADWASLARLARADHEEANAREGRPVWSQEVSDQMVARKRQRSDQLPFFLASLDGRDVGHGCAWAGTPEEKVGMVEDLFTDPGFRHRGVASALIFHGIAWARAAGAGPVMIGAVDDDTPRLMYAAMGFRPVFVSRTYISS